MKPIQFTKLNATGNDFIVIDNRNNIVDVKNHKRWSQLCTVKSGIGADGVLLLEKSDKADLKMHYINADGGEVEMCGNGARAMTFFAAEVLADKKESYTLETMNGVYECSKDSKHGFQLFMSELYDFDKISLSDLEKSMCAEKSMYMNTGVPHAVFQVSGLDTYPVFDRGRRIRYDQRFVKGSNANFFEVLSPGHLRIRTYERGVENETLSCGTGATATALAAAQFFAWKDQIILDAPGGQLAVKFTEGFKSVYLCGKVEKIFSGTVLY